MLLLVFENCTFLSFSNKIGTTPSIPNGFQEDTTRRVRKDVPHNLQEVLCPQMKSFYRELQSYVSAFAEFVNFLLNFQYKVDLEISLFYGI